MKITLKSKKLFSLPITYLFLLIFINGCSLGTEESEDLPNETETFKQIVQTTVHTSAVGFGAVMATMISEEESRKAFLRTYINYNIFFPDSTGYFYVNDFWGINIAHGTDLSHEGQNRWELQDSRGTFFIQDLINNAIQQNHEFVTYYYLNPSTEQTEEKHAYAEAITGTSYALTSGFYLENDTEFIPNLDKNKLIVSGVAHTFAFGSGSICESFFADTENQTLYFRKYVENVKFFPDESGYLFVVDFDGLCFAHGANKSIEGTNVFDLQDSEGTFFIREMITIAQGAGFGYVEYYYTNPSTNTDELKLVYVESINGTNYFVGAGVYLE